MFLSLFNDFVDSLTGSTKTFWLSALVLSNMSCDNGERIFGNTSVVEKHGKSAIDF